MTPIKEGILSTIGDTPLVHLSRALPDSHFRLYAKLEGFNPGGSIKDRPAQQIIRAGIEAGFVRSNTVIVESSSGNLGIGLAQSLSRTALHLCCRSQDNWAKHPATGSLWS
jgi:cysteine synthase